MRELKESITRSIVECYANFAVAIAEGSMSIKRLERKAKAIAKRTRKEKAKANREGRPVDAAKADAAGFKKARPYLVKREYKKRDRKARILGKAEVLAKGAAATGDAKGIARQIPTGGNDATQEAGRYLLGKNREGFKNARVVGRAINRAQSQEFNFQRKEVMDQEDKADKERRSRRIKDYDPNMN